MYMYIHVFVRVQIWMYVIRSVVETFDRLAYHGTAIVSTATCGRCVCAHTHIHVHIYIYICMYIYIYTYIYIY